MKRRLCRPLVAQTVAGRSCIIQLIHIFKRFDLFNPVFSLLTIQIQIFFFFTQSPHTLGGALLPAVGFCELQTIIKINIAIGSVTG